MTFLKSFVPRGVPVSAKERLRSPLGALVGILATGLVSRAAVGDGTILPVLIAPMGASAVLLFAVPASPLAQPWSIMGGNLISAFVGVSAALLLPNPIVAASLAIAIAIALMMSLRCLHPPSGAVALTAVLGGRAITELGYGFVLWPVGVNSLLLLLSALFFNNLAGRTYPHRPDPSASEQRTKDLRPMARVGISPGDLDAALADYNDLLEVDRGDIEAILRAAEFRSYRRRSGPTTCATVMSRDVVAIAPDAPIGDALGLLRAHRIKALPVTDQSAKVIGIVTQTDVLDKPDWGVLGPRLGLWQRLRLTARRGRAPTGSVEDIMTTPAVTATPEMVLADVVALMVRTSLHHLPVVGARDSKLVGIVSQSDLLTRLLAEVSAGRPEVDG